MNPFLAQMLQDHPEWFSQQNTSPPTSSSSSSTSDELNIEREIEEDEATQRAMHYVIRHELPQLLTPEVRHTRKRLDRERVAGHNRLYKDYFADDPVYPPNLFRRRYRMRRELFLRIVRAAEDHNVYFHLRPDCTGAPGLSSLQKCTVSMFMLGYGQSADKDDHYIRIGESTAREAMNKFCQAVIAKFGDQYLRRPTRADLQRLLLINERRGFPGMIGSIDCMHWEWKNCPVSWRGMYQGRSGKGSLVLEAVASQDLWIWHSFFGTPGSCNDLNVLHKSPLFDEFLSGRAPPVNFVVNGNQYDKGYYLTDGIYPQWSTFVKSITLPQTPKDQLFAQRQEAVRKDVERAFGVLQARFAIVRNPSLAWCTDTLDHIITACIIMHNMIVEDERHTYAAFADTSEFYKLPAELIREGSESATTEDDPVELSNERIFDINQYLLNIETLQDRIKHQSLKNDLVEHIWQTYSN